LIFIVFILDRIGRRRPLLFGALGISIVLVCEAVLNAVNERGERHGVSKAGIFFIFSYVYETPLFLSPTVSFEDMLITCSFSVIFSLSFGPVSWVYMSEIMPLSIRGRGNAFAAGSGNWLVATILAQISPIALARIGWKYYFVFVAFNVFITIPTVALLFKETKQLSLEEIDLLFENDSSPNLNTGRLAAERERRRSSVLAGSGSEFGTLGKSD
jgi:MFS family permease